MNTVTTSPELARHLRARLLKASRQYDQSGVALTQQKVSTQNILRVQQNAMRSVQQNEDFQELQKFYQEGGENLNEQELHAMQQNPPKTVLFPLVPFLAALTKDVAGAIITILTAVESVGTISTVLAWILDIVCGAILFFWLFQKFGFGYKKESGQFPNQIKKIISKTAFRRLPWMLAGEGVPLIEILPFMTLFVVTTYQKEKKASALAKKTLGAWKQSEFRAVRQESRRLK